MSKNKKLFKPSLQTTIAQFNKVSLKNKPINQKIQATICRPFRILLPDYFNIPAFEDPQLNFHSQNSQSIKEQSPNKYKQIQQKVIAQQNPIIKKRVKDLTILAEGMKRAKNKKQQSRYYFALAVIMHNSYNYQKALDYLQQFFKLVLQLRDQKSLELALNALGCQYMYIGNFQKAKQFHKKQREISTYTDKFISTINIGYCQQIEGQLQQAYQNYQLLKKEQEANLDQYRKNITDKLLERIQDKILQQQVFMTQNFGKSSPSKSPRKNSPQITKKSSLAKKKSSKIMNAIQLAQQSMDEHLMSASQYFSPRKQHNQQK